MVTNKADFGVLINKKDHCDYNSGYKTALEGFRQFSLNVRDDGGA